MGFLHAAVFLLARGARRAIGLVAAVFLVASVLAGEGQATQWDSASWSEYRAKMNRKPVGEDQLAEELTLLRVLSGEYDDPSFEPSPGTAERLSLIRFEVASRALERGVRGSVKVSEESVTAVFEAEKTALAKPKRWHLFDIILRFEEGASDEARRAVLDRLESIRREIVGGAPFDVVARRESESSTRLRGGNLGMVSLSELAPNLAEVVAGLGEGDLSPVIELDSGLVLLRCTKVFEAEEPDVEQVRAKIERRLRGEAAKEALEALTQRLLAGAKLRVETEWLKQRQGGVVAVAEFSVGDVRYSLTADQLVVYLRTRHEVRPLTEIQEEELVALIEDRVLLELREHEAVARGLFDAEVEETVRWKERELEARAVLDARVDVELAPPAEEQLRKAYERRKDQLIEPEMRHLRMIRIDIESNRLRSYYESVRELGIRAASGEASLEEVARKLDGEVVDLGWLAPNDVWRMGRVVNDAVGKLEVGGVTQAIQEGRVLLIVELAGRRDERILSFEETREMLLGEIMKRKRLQTEEAIRQQILSENRHESP